MAENRASLALADQSATALKRLIAVGELSARELVAGCLERIAATNPVVNAIVTLTADAAMASAAVADDRQARGETLGLLHGLPVAHKDLALTAGVRTTFGSPIFADFVPTQDALVVARSKAAGAISVGKTNTPEFGAGSQTFNRVFGATANPWDVSRTCGGSSGGAATALACGMVPFADGSDMGGSLRNPANFCGVVGLRPSPGRVPTWPARFAWGSLGVEGPMARTVADLALFLAALAGPDPRSPLSIEGRPHEFESLSPATLKGLRLAWSPALGDLPVDPEVASVLAAARVAAEGAGGVIADIDPPLAHADEAFETLRAFQFELGFGHLYDRSPDQLKDTVRWNIEAGRALTGPDIGRAELYRSEIFAAIGTYFERFDVLVTVVSQVVPFSLAQEYPMVVAGQEMSTYIEWMRSCSRITVTGCPALSLPAGFTRAGLPVGIQLVGPYRGERRLLEIALAFEEMLGTATLGPPVLPVLARDVPPSKN